MIQIRRYFIIALMVIGFVMNAGCDGNVGRAVQGVRDLEPEVDKRNQEIDELANPSSDD